MTLWLSDDSICPWPRIFSPRSSTSAPAGTPRASPSSDIDLLVTLEDGRTLLDLVAIKQDLEDLLGSSVDVVTENALSPRIRPRILAEATLLSRMAQLPEGCDPPLIKNKRAAGRPQDLADVQALGAG